MGDVLKISFDAALQRRTPAKARAAVQQLLGDDAPLTMIRDALLLTSEVITNALLHAPGGCFLRAQFVRDRQWLRVEVCDSSSAPPKCRSATSKPRVGGQGLRIVDAVSNRWGWNSSEHGKVVWFELSPSGTV